ncbi:hypothetical protein [Pseudomonas monsensis]
MAEEKELTEEAKKQRRKREKAAAKDAALGVEKFTVEVAGVFKPDLKRVMAAHGINNQQDIHQRLLKNLIDADFETQTWMLRNVTTPYEPSEKVSRAFYEKSMAELAADPGDEIVSPSILECNVPSAISGNLA